MKFQFALPLFAALAVAACSSKPTSSAPETLPVITGEVPLPPARPSVAKMAGPKGSKVQGMVTFKDEGKKIHVIGQIMGLKKNSEHGLHVHENGDCTPPKFETAGGHWNPQHTEHGSADSKNRHPGDLGNVKSDAKGSAVFDFTIPAGAGVGTFAGKSLIVHAKADDLHTQPSGDSGDRLACGLIIEQEK